MANANIISLKTVRLSEDNQNLYEAVKGQWGQLGDKNAVFTIVKNLLVVNLLDGARYTDTKLPEVYDGFVQCSDGTRIQIKDSTLTCSLPSGVNGFGVLVLKKWN